MLQVMKSQEIYINMDDSGILHKNDLYCIYGGIAFVGKDNRDCFIRKYNSIKNKIRCNYCSSKKENCHHRCPEIKDTNIHNSHKRWLFNLIKKEVTFAVIIKNEKVLDYIMHDVKSRGRFRDYAQRRLIRCLLEFLIFSGRIDPYKPIKLVIRIDQQGTSTDTNRYFIDDIKKELTEGIFNQNFKMIHKPILFSQLDIDLKYVLSHKHVCIQASDLIAGETRKVMLGIHEGEKKYSDFKKIIDIKLFLP